MLIPVYTIVALINIFAKSQNFNFRPSKDLPYEIRVKRDLINTQTYAKDNADIKTEEILNGLEVDKETIKENRPDNFMNRFRIAVTEASFKNDKIVNSDIAHKYKKSAKKPSTITQAGLDDKITLNNQEKGNVMVIDNSENDYLLPKEIKTWKKFKEALEKDQRSIKHSSLVDYPKIAKTQGLNLEIGEKRMKRNFGSNGNNQNNNNYINQNGYNDNYNQNTNNDVAESNMDNYRVTEKTTLGRAFDWVKNLINPHEKYVITNVSEYSQTHSKYSLPYTENDSRDNTITTPKYNWNYGNNNNIYSAGIQNFDTATPNGYNYNGQQYPYYGTYNSNLETKPTYEAGVNPTPNGIKRYNYQQQYPYYSNGNTPQNTNGFQPLNEHSQNNFSSYNTNNDYGYNGINGNGYNQNVFNNTGLSNINGYGYNPFPVNNVTDATEDTTDNITVLGTCILCGSFGCPLLTRRVGFRCVPIRH